MLGGRVNLHERVRRYLYTAMVAGASLVCTAALASLAYAQVPVTTQVTGNGLSTSVTPVANGVEITGGTRPGPGGPNLFHSFGLFNVGTGDTANFVNNSALSTTNIIGRVTDARSDIFGTIKTTGFGAANLWLINPRGFVFGPEATLDVGGSFHASTADYLKFSDGNIFFADPARTSALSVAPPSAFGFLSAPTGPIDVLAGTADETTAPVTIKSLLKVPEGKTLSLVGGEVNIGGQVDLNNDGTPDVSGPGYILAPGGHVNLVSVASSGEATFDPTNINGSTGGPVTGVPSTRDINVSGVAQLGNINITQGSIVDAKEVSISGGQLVIDTAAVYPGGFWFYDNLGVLTVSGISDPLPAPDGGLVNVNIAGDVSIRGDTLVPVINDLSGILTVAGSLFAEVPGDVPNIRLNAHSLTLAGETADIQAVRFGPGKAADVSITADSVRIENGAGIETLNFFQGPGGSLAVNTGDLVIDGGRLSAQGFFHPGYLVFSVDPIVYFADAGTITVNASNTVTLRNSAFIVASSFAFGSGGGVTVNTKNLSLDNQGFILAETTLGGPAGKVEINASGQVNLANNSQISSTTSGSGTGGNVVITAGQSTTVSGSSGIFASTVPPNQGILDVIASNFALLVETLRPGAFPDYATLQSIISEQTGIPNPTIFDVLRSLRDDFGVLKIPDSMLIPGNGGATSITTPLLTVINGAAISSSTGWDGNAGEVVGNVGSLVVESGGEIRSRTGLVSGEISLIGQGKAGNLRFDATDTIAITGGSISTTTLGDGAAGNISLTANQVDVQNGGSVTSASGGTIDGQLFVGAGNAGQISVSAPTLTMGESGTISVATSGAGNAGNISLNVNNFTQTGGAQVVSSTTSAGQGGNLTLAATESASFSGSGSGLFSTASSTGNAGEVTVSTPTLAMNNGAISVATSGAGNAGNISLNVANFTQTGGAQVVSSTTSAGQGGNLTLAATESSSFSGSGSGLFSTAGAAGAAGQITLSTPTLAMSDGGAISAATEGSGAAGNISLSVNSLNLATGAQVLSSTTGDGAGGTVAVTAGELVSISGAGTGLLSTASGTGNAGQITVTAPALAPVPTLTMADGGTISVATSGAGSAGSILLNANNFSLTGGAQVVSSTTGAGEGGSVTATAGESISISGSGSGLFSTASSTGNAGQITVSTPTLTMGESGTISVATEGTGNAGNIALNVSNLTQTGGAQVVSSTTGAGAGGNLTVTAANSISVSGSGSEPSGLFSTASSTGNAGEVTVSTPTLTMGESGTISVATSGAGNAGNVLLNVNNFSLTGGAQIVSSTSGAGQGGSVTANATNSASISGTGTGLFSTASGSGAGGNIHIQSGQLIQLADNATLSAQSTGTATATAGNITINTPTFETQNASVTTGATLADGGNISITTTGSLVHLSNSQITTSVQSGEGSGGNITIGSDLIVLDDSQVLANAFGGPGGNITITGDVFLVNSGGQSPISLAGIVEASSALSTPGTINIEAAVTDVSGTVAQLPEAPLQATELLRAACAARFVGGKTSSLVLGGRDGLPLQPGSLLPSPLYVASEADKPSTISSSTGFSPPTGFSLLGSSDRNLNRYSLLPNFKCSL